MILLPSVSQFSRILAATFDPCVGDKVRQALLHKADINVLHNGLQDHRLLVALHVEVIPAEKKGRKKKN